MTDITDLPRWNTSAAFDSLDDRRLADAIERAGAGIDRLTALFDERGIRAVDRRPPSGSDAAAADALISALNDVESELRLLRVFTHAFVTTNSYDATAQATASQVEALYGKLVPLHARLADWVRALGVDDLAALSPQVAEHRGPLRHLAARSAHQMSEAEEHLYGELRTTGANAWARLHGDLTSQLTATVALPGGPATLPMAEVRGMATHPDAAVRRAALVAELAAWPAVEVGCAAALNAIKGEANAINRRRRWTSPLEASLFANSVSAATFAAMQVAVDELLAPMRRWMRAKAAALGHAGGLPWYDLLAPLPVAAATLEWADGMAGIRSAFGGFSAGLGGLVDRAVSEEWIDAGPRRGKRGGAYCMPFVGDRSLVFMNWDGSADSAQTAAHELGHAYHNTQLAGRTPLQQRLPMALAETASIFCETLVVEHGLRTADDRQRLALLDLDLSSAAQTVLDIHSRFLFETDVFARRQRRTIGAAELCEMMVHAQLNAYGDGLDSDVVHPYMWAVKPHYYNAHFYNWPYTYGLLFGLGLFDQYRIDPDRFRAAYDDLLSRAGMATTEELAGGFGLDVTDRAFWMGSVAVLVDRIDKFVALTGST